MLDSKKVLVAVCGSIAAYKTAFFVRLLVKAGAEVRVIMTESATQFISPLTLSTLSKNPVLSQFTREEGDWNNHVELGLWADLIVVAPLSANTLAKLAHGLCDNLLTAVYLSARCPVMACPAMDLDMYRHPSTQLNIRSVKNHGVIIIDAETGELASGLHGEGRMAEPEHIFEKILQFFQPKTLPLAGKHVLMTSGPTYEAIDPVRFIGNHSTGKMGQAIAMELAILGAQISFISGPTAHYPSHPHIKVIKVTSADEMYQAAQLIFPESDIAVFTAAVADYKPATKAPSKLKKEDTQLTVTLVPNPDIAGELGKIKTNQYTVGFALETDQEKVNARQKLQKKNLDLIVLNSLNDQGAGFAHDTNKVTIFDNNNNVYDFELKTKEEVAKDLVNLIVKNYE